MKIITGRTLHYFEAQWLNSIFRSLNEKDEKKKLKNANMPWRWMSLETFEKHIYTQASDVWSFGIVMWEIFTFGKMPYMTLETDEILKFLQEVSIALRIRIRNIGSRLIRITRGANLESF